MKICVLGLRGLPSVMGGVETHCEQLYPLLKELRPNDSFTIIGRNSYLHQKALEYKGLRIISLPHAKGKHLETITSTICGILYARFVLHAELIHLHGLGPAILAPVAKAFGQKVVVTYHSKNYDHQKWNSTAKLILRIGEWCAIRFGDRIIAVAHWLADDLARRFPSAAPKICFIPNGADHLRATKQRPYSEDQLLAKYHLEKNRYIIYVGRLTREKGLRDLIDAFKETTLNYKLLVVGDADHKDEYSHDLFSQASETVVFTGFLPCEPLQVLLENASLFVLPSYYEGLPIAALEAAVAGAPLLLSDIEANRDLALSDDHYFCPGDVEGLRKKMTRDHRLYRVDRDKILREYSWTVVCAQTSEVLSSLQD